jgi:hypothetical protein
MPQCQGKVKGGSIHSICGSPAYRCKKCGAVGCKNKKCPNYILASNSSCTCSRCGGVLEPGR